VGHASATIPQSAESKSQIRSMQQWLRRKSQFAVFRRIPSQISIAIRQSPKFLRGGSAGFLTTRAKLTSVLAASAQHAAGARATTRQTVSLGTHLDRVGRTRPADGAVANGAPADGRGADARNLPCGRCALGAWPEWRRGSRPDSDLDHTRFGCVPTAGGWGGAHARFYRGGAPKLLARVNGGRGRRPPHGGRPAAPAHAPIAQLPRLSHGLPPSPRHAGSCAQLAAPRDARAPLRAARSPIRLRPPGPTRGTPPATAARRWTPETGRRQGTRKGAPGRSALNAAQRTWQAARRQQRAGAVGAGGAAATHCVVARAGKHRPRPTRAFRCGVAVTPAPQGDVTTPQLAGSNTQAQWGETGRRQSTACQPALGGTAHPARASPCGVAATPAAPQGDAPTPQLSGRNAQAQRGQAGRRTHGVPACVGGQAGRYVPHK
jgi:hypothetical protein